MDQEESRTTWHAGTGDVHQVSCPNCLLTDEYKQALALIGDDDDESASNAALNRLESVAKAS